MWWWCVCEQTDARPLAAGPNADDPAELELDDDPEECSRLDVARVGASSTRFDP